MSRLLLAGALLVLAPRAAAQEVDETALVAAERREAELLRRRGDLVGARRTLLALLEDEPRDVRTRAALAEVLLEAADYARAQGEARRALEDAQDPRSRAAAAAALAEIELALGRPAEALAGLAAGGAELEPARHPRGARLAASALAALGRAEEARAALRAGAATQAVPAAGSERPQLLLERARCQRRLGDLPQASASLVEAERAASAEGRAEAEILVELGELYFEADREVAEAGRRSAADLFREALERAPGHAGALLGLHRLHRYNWLRRSRSAEEILDELLAGRPDHIEGLLAGAGADLDDGRLPAARARVERLNRLAPGRRELRALVAALAWVEGRQDECRARLAELSAEAPADSGPEREVGRHLLELYRFAEGLGFLRAAVERDPKDHEAWTQLGRALANTGDEPAAIEALERATKEAAGRQDAWRANTLAVLRRMRLEHVRHDAGELVFSWEPDAARVLETYLVPFYAAAREELAERYGYTPGPTTIQVFRRHKDFSARSTGFEGFPALGVCFGPVVTAVSPLSELRGSFSWARTSFHEFTHVVHLGLSHNRCPRWITEGLATWEEVAKDASWTRNMRRDLLDARANGELIAVRDLNRAFRGPRILFGYYQGGLLCQMLIERHGFSPMVRVLEAFDRGLDLDQALAEVFRTTPEALDRDFRAFVDRELAGLALEPRWSPASAARLRLELGREPPAAEEERRAWAEGWTTLAWSAWQARRRVDADEALQRVARAGLPLARAEFLRGELALAARERERAREIWERAFELEEGRDDFRARVAAGSLALEAGETESAERHWKAAERAFPGFPERELCAELKLAALYFELGRFEEEKLALERWLEWESSDLEALRKVAVWHFDAGRAALACERYRRANEIDPFLRRLHRDWGEALLAAERPAEALREFEVAALVPPELDQDRPGPLEDWERAELLGLGARALEALGRSEEALARAHEGLALDPECDPCRAVTGASR